MGKLDMQEVFYGCYRIYGGLTIKKAFTKKFRAILYVLKNRSRADFIEGWLEHGFENKEEHFYE